MHTFLLIHRHDAGECHQAQVAWKTAVSSLPDTALSACADGGHAIWWKVRASSGSDALALLPERLRGRVHPVPIA